MLFIEGFDFIDEEGYSEYLSKMNEMQQLEPNAFDGIDVYFLNLKNPYRDLRDNAMSVFGVLQYLNSNNGYNEGTRIFGFSMGGVLARYALAFAEHSDIQHYCSQLVSFDSPNQGAVLNESLQSRVIAIYNDLVWKETVENAVWWIPWIGDFRDRVKAGKALVKPYIDAINSVAAKQLLL